MIHPLGVCLVEPTDRAPSGVLIQHFCFGGDTGDQYHILIYYLGMDGFRNAAVYR